MKDKRGRDMSRICEFEDRMNPLLKNEPRIVAVECRGHEDSVHRTCMRKLAILLPGILVCGPIFAGDERAELLDRGGVGYECVSKELAGIRAFMVRPMAPGLVEKPDGRSKSGAQLRTGAEMFSVIRHLAQQPIANQSTDERTNYRETTSNYGKSVRIKFHGTGLQFWSALLVGGFVGIALAAAIIITFGLWQHKRRHHQSLYTR